MMHRLHILSLGIILMAVGCRPDSPVPKPRGFFKVDLPEQRAYRTFDSAGFPYTFEYPVYGKIVQDQNLIQEEHEPYWINVSFPELNAIIYLSYKKITPSATLDKLIDDSYSLTGVHKKRADYIETPQINTPSGLQGVFYIAGGNTASRYQFFVTDKTQHFLRGSLYFNATPNSDSLAPVNEYLRKDVEHLIETLRFK